LRAYGGTTRKYVIVLTIQCDTSRFLSGPRNGFKCSICRGQFIPFPPDTTAVVIVALSVGFTIVRDAATGATIHDCRGHEINRPLVADMGEILRAGRKVGNVGVF
jgi:hypothetical protein